MARRITKAEIEERNYFVLEMIAKGKTRTEMLAALISHYKITPKAASRAYEIAMKSVRQGAKESVHDIRAKKIITHNNDIQEAFQNYLEAKNAEDTSSSIKWFDQYAKLRSSIDKYYPNDLKPSDSKDDTKIEITYSTAVKLKDAEDED